MSDVNNKEKQFSGGNWGHPRKYTKKHTKIANPLIPEIPKYRKKRGKSKKKKEYRYAFFECPFCNKELKSLNADKFFSFRREDFCRHCGAKEVLECPACKQKTWLKDGIYKHNSLGCGFEGKANIKSLTSDNAKTCRKNYPRDRRKKK